MVQDSTVIYYSCNAAPQVFINNTLHYLQQAAGDLSVIGVSHQPMFVAPPKNWTNLVVEMPRNHFSIYKQALIGAKEAVTEFIHLAEDDVLYSPEHFKYRPRKKPFAYNLGYWGIYTWQDPPIFNYKGRKNLGNLVCDREAFIEAMEERFAKYPDPDNSIKDIWAEPGKYERQLGVTPCDTEDFYTNPPNIKFSHIEELSFSALGTRKRAGELRATEIPFWYRASDIKRLYEESHDFIQLGS